MPNNTVVIYKSKYGSTRRYAQWIAEEAPADLLEHAAVQVDDLLKYDTIVYGGGLYAVGILGLSLIKKHLSQLHGKKIIIFSVGAAPPRESGIKDVMDGNFSHEMRSAVHYVPLRGGFDYDKLSFIDKILMSLLKVKIRRKKPENRTADEKGMLASYDHPVDFTKKSAIQPILDLIHQ